MPANWLEAGDVGDGVEAGTPAAENTELRDARRRIRLLEQENEVQRRAVRQLAATDAPVRVPVAVTCRVLGLARHPYCRWLTTPVTTSGLEQAHRANAPDDAHRDDAEFGCRHLATEAAGAR